MSSLPCLTAIICSDGGKLEVARGDEEAVEKKKKKRASAPEVEKTRVVLFQIRKRTDRGF